MKRSVRSGPFEKDDEIALALCGRAKASSGSAKEQIFTHRGEFGEA